MGGVFFQTKISDSGLTVQYFNDLSLLFVLGIGSFSDSLVTPFCYDWLGRNKQIKMSIGHRFSTSAIVIGEYLLFALVVS